VSSVWILVKQKKVRALFGFAAINRMKKIKQKIIGRVKNFSLTC